MPDPGLSLPVYSLEDEQERHGDEEVIPIVDEMFEPFARVSLRCPLRNNAFPKCLLLFIFNYSSVASTVAHIMSA